MVISASNRLAKGVVVAWYKGRSDYVTANIKSGSLYVQGVHANNYQIQMDTASGHITILRLTAAQSLTQAFSRQDVANTVMMMILMLGASYHVIRNGEEESHDSNL